MEEIKTALRPLTDALPQQGRDFLDGGGWWLVLGLVGLLAVLFLLALLRGLWRLVFGRRKKDADWDRGLREDLGQCPLPVSPPADRRLTVYHLPVRLRLVVVASAGKEDVIDATAVEQLLDLVVPGLSEVARHDRPRVRVWPPQPSHHGFGMVFHRCTQKPEPDGSPSRWVLLAGGAQAGRRPVLLGLGLWADEPNALGRLTLERHQWLDLLRLRGAGE